MTMERRHGRKPTSELGRTARYYLRRSLNPPGGPARNNVDRADFPHAGRAGDESSESDENGNNSDLNMELDPATGPHVASDNEDAPHNDLNINNNHDQPPYQHELANNDLPRNNIPPLNNLDIRQHRVMDLHEVGNDNFLNIVQSDDEQAENNMAQVNPPVNHNEANNLNIEEENLNYDDAEVNSEDSDGASDSDDLSEDDEDMVHHRFNRALYQGANITLSQSMLLVLGLMLEHNLTATCVADILTVIQFHCLNDALQKVSLYKFNKFFALGPKGTFKKHFYCSVCLSTLRNENARCPLCVERNQTAYFIVMPFLAQLQEMFRRNNFYDQLQSRFNRNNNRQDIQDIYDGKLYRDLVVSGFLSNPNNISLTWFTDGVPVFKSSKTSMWPIYLCINELPYQLRRKQANILLAGLWFGPKKPSSNLFLNKLRPQFNELFNGKDFNIGRNVVRVRGVLLAGTCDVPAKTDFLNLTLYSGAFGCCNWKLEGYTFHHPSGGHSHVFPYVRNIEERTSAETILQGRQAINEDIRRGVMGVKGVSVLSLIMPDFIGGTGIDVMHKVYGGVVKKLLYLWFDPSNRGEPFSLTHVIENIDKRLKALKPPKFVHRMPRSVIELCHWKASELKMWFYYYSPLVLYGIILPVYLNHYMLLIFAISVLNSQNISRDDLEKFRKLIHRFVREFSELYSERHSTINVHGLLHLPECVERLGPLWAYNCFPFEDLNGKLLQTIHGTSHLDSQVAVRHCQIIKLHRKFEQVGEGQIKDFLFNCGRKRQVAINERIQHSCYSVGSYVTHEVVPRVVMMGLQNSNIQPGFLQTYCRLLKDEKLYVSEQYPRNMKTLSSYAVYLQNGMRQVGCIHVFVKIRQCNCRRDCNCEAEHYAVINEVQTSNVFYAVDDEARRYPLWHLKGARRNHVMRAVPIRDLVSVCVYMSAEGIAPLVGYPINDVEQE